ncbi:MAG: hypothetical protein ACI4FX_03715 [Agathobacter sp.]
MLLAASLATAMVITSATAQPVWAATTDTGAVTKEAGSEASSFPQITSFALDKTEADVSNGTVKALIWVIF